MDLMYVYDRECPNCHNSLGEPRHAPDDTVAWACAHCGYSYERVVTIMGDEEFLVAYDEEGDQVIV